MNNIILLLIGLLLLLIINKDIVEQFTDEKCDITDRKIQLLEEKMVLETKQTKQVPDETLTKRFDQIDQKIKELDQKIIENKKINEEQKIIQNKKIKEEQSKYLEQLKSEQVEEEEIYSDIISWDTSYSKYLINVLIIFLIGTIVMFILYFFFSYLVKFGKSRKLKIEKVNIKYDSILDEIKKNKVKDSLKVKKGSFFNFLDNNYVK